MKRYPPYKYIIALLDWLMINSAFLTALRLQPRLHVGFFHSMFPFLPAEVLFFLGYSAVVILIFQYLHLYKLNVILSRFDQGIRIVQGIIYSVLGLALLSFFTKSHVIVESRQVILYFGLLSASGLIVTRVLFVRSIFSFLAKNKIYQRSVLLVGAGISGRMVAANIGIRNSNALRAVGFVDDDLAVETVVFQDLKVLGKVDDIPRLIESLGIDEILVCMDNIPHERLLVVLDTCQKGSATVKVASPLYDVIPARIFTERYGEIPVVGVFNATPGLWRSFFKKFFDLALSAFGLLLLMPLFAAVAVAIKLDSSGPLFYRQSRIGKDGKPFLLYKFRSMVVGSDRDESRKKNIAAFIEGREGQAQGNSMKIVDKSKITRVGRILRKTSIDELPQLINILKGEMSLVGPRPCLPYEWDHYQVWHKKRLSVTPGCTGVWQVTGRSEVGFEDMVILDLFYIQNASLPFDLKVLLQTIPVVVFGRGGG